MHVYVKKYFLFLYCLNFYLIFSVLLTFSIIVSKWKEHIKENMICIINNRTIYDNDFKWNLTDHPKKFVFLGGTTVISVEIDNIPHKQYFIKDFDEMNIQEKHIQ